MLKTSRASSTRTLIESARATSSCGAYFIFSSCNLLFELATCVQISQEQFLVLLVLSQTFQQRFNQQRIWQCLSRKNSVHMCGSSMLLMWMPKPLLMKITNPTHQNDIVEKKSQKMHHASKIKCEDVTHATCKQTNDCWRNTTHIPKHEQQCINTENTRCDKKNMGTRKLELDN